MRIPFQLDRPVFANRDLLISSQRYKRNDHIPWKEAGLDWELICKLYDSLAVKHDEKLEDKAKVGDGLELLSIQALNELVDKINTKVKENTESKRKFDAMKCKKSKIADKQRGLIRSWRRQYGEMENL